MMLHRHVTAAARGDSVRRASTAKDRPMRAATTMLALLAVCVMSTAAKASPADEVRAVYQEFAAAQNARDLAKVSLLLLDSPTFLWVSDGKSVWGREATLKRMALFQDARIWHVEPDLGKAVGVTVSDSAAFLHLPLALDLAFTPAPPERLRFLVSVLGVRTSEGWRIAALFTATENPQ
jgi:hypothetical protein